MSAFTLPWLTSTARPHCHRRRILILAFAVVALVGTDLLWAASRGGGGGGGSSAGSRGSHGGGGHHRHSGGHHHHHGSHVNWGFGFGFGWPWLYPWSSYPWPYYYDYGPAPAYYPPQTYYVPPPPTSYVLPPQTVQSSEPDGYWYYCPASKTFYPYVKECSVGQWERVEPRAPPPGSDNVRSYTSP